MYHLGGGRGEGRRGGGREEGGRDHIIYHCFNDLRLIETQCKP